MPIESIQQTLHIRRKINRRVFENIDRLWTLGQTAESHQDILDGLHPWNAPIGLKFNNTLSLFLGLFGILFIFTLFFYPHGLWPILCITVSSSCIFIAYLSYESNQPIENTINYLNTITITKKYQLQHGKVPHHIDFPISSLNFILYIKQLFPLFNQGNISNQITKYASTIWEDHNGQQHNVLIFQYNYINAIQATDTNGDTINLKRKQYDTWGVLIFDVEIHGLAITATQNEFAYPYNLSWETSDIQINQRLKFYGHDQLLLAKQITPAFTLKVADFFAHRSGDLMFHPDKNVMCYLGSRNLFKTSSKFQKIQDVSALRGHLRTFKLPYLDQLKTDLVQFLK